ncbi:unnamed protein product [Prorocentrum cordatum]|uniref:Uncharacterized protein n=1 Tax=Prorocentrum cordatum TaxID=2364126 RepID=A0ABN9WHT2_9DINO|nr:unnamed protein product [Polarella glacialis]
MAGEQSMTCESVASRPSCLEREYPMFVVPMQRMFEKDRFQIHEDLRDEDKLVEHKEESADPVVFLSQTWFSASHPDPDGVKHDLWKRMLEKMKQSKLRVNVHWLTELFFGTSTTGLEDKLKDVAEKGFYWMDIECCPQRNKDKMAMACRSIPHYVQRSSFFIVLVPQSLHVEKGVVVDCRTWERRGWCRGERAFNALSQNPKLCIVAESTSFVYVQMSRDWLWRQPCTGDLTAESDRDAIGSALLSALDSCAEHARQKGDMTRCRMTLAIKPEQLRGSESGVILEPDFNDWMQQMGFTSHDDEKGTGWTPLRFAMYAGFLNVARELVKRGADVNAPLSEGNPGWGWHMKGCTILHGLSFMRDDPVGMEFLIEQKADPTKAYQDNLVPHIVAMNAGRVGNVDVLMKHAPKLALHCDDLGNNCWHVALFGGQSEAFKYFTEKYPDYVDKDSFAFGSNVVGSAVLDACDLECTKAVLAMNHDANFKHQPGKLSPKIKVGMRINQAFNYMSGSPSMLNEYMANMDSATPIMLASFLGNLPVVQELLKARAHVDATNSYNRTALTVAAMQGRVEIVKELLAAGTNATIVDTWGRTAGDWARFRGHERAAVLLPAGASAGGACSCRSAPPAPAAETA